MKIYFAGSIRGGRDDAAIYSEIINKLKKWGEVVTEHVADAGLSEWGEADSTDEEIYQRDIAWLSSASAVVAEITQPSLGVGYEIGQAEAQGKPVLCLYRMVPDRRVSPMMLGNQNLKQRSYANMSDVDAILEEFFGSISS